MIDSPFLSQVQSSGWLIHSVDGDRVTAKCPRYGCALMTYLYPGKPIPNACSPSKDMAEVAIKDMAEAFRFLIERRHDIGLDQLETTDCIGLVHGHLHKLESGARTGRVDTFLAWAQALGYEMVLRPVGLPPKTLLTIAQTRDRAAIRKRRRQKAQPKALPRG